MKNVMFVLGLMLFASTSFGSSKWYNSSGTNLGVKSDVKCGSGVSCSVVAGKVVITFPTGDGTSTHVGFLQSQAGTSTVDAGDLGITFCGGTILGGYGTTVALPNAALALGCRYTFVTTSGQSIVDTDGTDQIIGLTDVAGDKITNSTAGNSVTLESVGANSWAPVAIYGTWADGN